MVLTFVEPLPCCIILHLLASYHIVTLYYITSFGPLWQGREVGVVSDGRMLKDGPNGSPVQTEVQLARVGAVLQQDLNHLHPNVGSKAYSAL